MTRVMFAPTRKGKTKKITVGDFDIYVTVNCLESGPGEVFIKIGKEGSTIAALFDAIATTISIALQYGVPWADLRNKYLGCKFEPLDIHGHSILHRIAETIEELSK